MGRRYFSLYENICHPFNLWQAYLQARQGKRSQLAVAAFEYELESELIQLEEELRSGSYQPGGYTSFRIRASKPRLVNAAPFRDRVVHHALINVIGPLFERQFISDSYANRRGKGTHRALDRCTYFLRRYHYVMLCDVVQFFPSVDLEILTEILGRTIGDSRVMDLIGRILAGGAGVQAAEYDMVYFPGDDLFARLRPRGLPIGNLTSQHWANVYLNELDQYAKRTLRIHGYVRYVDDILLFAQEKAELHAWKEAIQDFLQRLRLTLHTTRAQPRPVLTGVPFLGFQVFPDHRRLKRRNGLTFQRRLCQLIAWHRCGLLEEKDLRCRVKGWINHASHGDTWGLRRAVLFHAGLFAE